MPWQKRTEADMREEFVNRVKAHEKSKAALCREYGISRPTGDKWLARYEEGESLENKSRAPHHISQHITPEMEQEIVELRRKYPALGAVKLHHMMQRNSQEKLPCAKTFNNVFKRNGLITPSATLAATPYKRYEKDEPNIMWQQDFKGHYALRDGTRCHPLNVMDDCSRYSLCSEALDGETLDKVWPVEMRLFAEYGLPKSILCDNGNPWGVSQTIGFTMFEVQLMDLGILPLHGRTKHPQTQGKQERFNGSMLRELLSGRKWDDMASMQEALTGYRQFYNNERPHHSLHLDTPSAHYHRSERELPQRIAPWEYDSGYQVRRVRGNGYFNYQGHAYFLSEAFIDHDIGIRPSHKDGCVTLEYREFKIARINLTEKTYEFRRAYLKQDDPRQRTE